jgi:hypothetical protein
MCVELLTDDNTYSDEYTFGWLQGERNNITDCSKDSEANSSRETVCKNINAERYYTVCLLDSQTLMLMEKRGHNV